ncbi:MAG: D-aminoacyl-tRNA deacylase [Candidatus Krumholzibacteriia bacterium]
MRVVVQRSGPAWVTIAGETVGAIPSGLVVLAAFAPADTEAELGWVARKLPDLRVFDDPAGKQNLSLRDVGGGILLVSQFTLYGDCRRGNRPSYVGSASPDRAAALYRRFGALLRDQWPTVAEGRFGAMMEVSLTNSGPVTLILDREGPA